MNPGGVVILVALTSLTLFAPRRWALIALVAGVLYLTLGQWVDIADLHIYPIRVLLLAAFVRVVVRREWSFASLHAVDTMVIVAYGYRTIVFLANGNGSATLGLGVMVDVTLAYFAFRGLLQSFDDLTWALRALAVLLVPYVGLLAIEVTTGQNPFVALGGIADIVIRDGRPRAIGSFGHASILGTFGASFIPLYLALWFAGSRAVGAIGVGLCLAIVYCSNSGGPLGCAAFAFIGWLLWGSRARMRIVRTSIVGGLFVLVLFMQAPIWYLPAKLSALSGGDGWHRSYLMDIAFRHFDQWWLAGMPLVATKPWFPYTVASGGADLVNYYLDFGMAAGIMATGLFCWMLTLAYSRLGRALRVARVEGAAPRSEQLLLWGCGVVLSLHVFNWFAICYFDQYQVIFLMHLAAISSLTSNRARPVVAPAIPATADAKPYRLRYAARRF